MVGEIAEWCNKGPDYSLKVVIDKKIAADLTRGRLLRYLCCGVTTLPCLRYRER